MNVKFLTPTQLWQGFDDKEGMELSVVYSHNTNDKLVRGVYFTAIDNENGKIRAFCEISAPADCKQKAAVCVSLCAKDYKKIDDIAAKAEKECIVIKLNLDGIPDQNGNCTKYEGKYESYRPDIAKRFVAIPSAEESAELIWAKIARRAVSALIMMCPQAEPILFGLGAAAVPAWQAATHDERVRGLITILGDYTLPDEKDEDNYDSWMMAISAKAAAHCVKCPCLMLTTAGNPDGDIFALSDIVNALPEGIERSIIVVPRLIEQLDITSAASMEKWANNVYDEKIKVVEPSLTASANNGELTYSVAGKIGDYDKVVLCYCFDEKRPEYRNWHFVETTATDDGYVAHIHASKDDKIIYAYAMVTKDGITVATNAVTTIASGVAPCRRFQFLCDTVSESGFFCNITDGPTVAGAEDFAIKETADGVPGFTAKGVLASNILSETNHYIPTGELHIGVYSETDDEIKVTLYKEQEDKSVEKYTAVAKVEAGEWTRLLLGVEDFKTAELIPMKDWEKLLRIELPNTEGKLYNNLLWL